MPRDRRKKREDADSFIDAGGSAPDEKTDSDEIKTFSVRFPEQLVEEVDSTIDEQMVSQSRNQWLMEAAVEKLERS